MLARGSLTLVGNAALSIFLLASWASAEHLDKRHTTADDAIFSLNEVFRPPANWNLPKTLYGRTVQLSDGTLLATWENFSPEPPPVYFPIYRSTDKGQTWTALSNITDDANNGRGLRYQPFLYQLPRRIGNLLPAGTVLAAGNSVPTDLSQTEIDLYRSADAGATWHFVAAVAAGGAAVPINGPTPVWEPFLTVHDGRLVVFYSDQSDPAHGQKLAHKTSANGVVWGEAVDDVASPVYADRPGMTTVAGPMPHGRYIMTYELCGAANNKCAVHYRVSDSPLTFADAPDRQLVATDGTEPKGSPYVVWSPSGGGNGTIVASAASHAQVFVNTALGDADSWVKYDTPQPAAYSRHLRIMDNPDNLLIMGAGNLRTDNQVTLSVMRLPNLS